MQRLRTAVRPLRALTRGGHSHHGGDAHHGDHHLSEAAARYQNQVPRLFGEHTAPGTRRQLEDWEPSFYWLLAGSAVVIALGVYRPDSNPRRWAEDEAAERMRRRELGLPVEVGVNYSALRFMRENGAVSEETAELLEGGAVASSTRHFPKLSGIKGPAATEAKLE